MSMIETIGTIPTPFGNLVCEQWGTEVSEYPCFDIALKREDGTEVLLAVVELDNSKEAMEYGGMINIRTYGDLSADEPDHVAVVDKTDLERYTEEREL